MIAILSAVSSHQFLDFLVLIHLNILRREQKVEVLYEFLIVR
jgi:hypothetical protein